MVKRDAAQAKSMQPFPLEFPVFSEGMTGLRKKLEAVHLWGWVSQKLSIVPNYQDNRVSTALVALISFLALPQAYLLPAFISLLWTMSVYVSRFLILGIKGIYSAIPGAVPTTGAYYFPSLFRFECSCTTPCSQWLLPLKCRNSMVVYHWYIPISFYPVRKKIH